MGYEFNQKMNIPKVKSIGVSIEESIMYKYIRMYNDKFLFYKGTIRRNGITIHRLSRSYSGKTGNYFLEEEISSYVQNKSGW